MQITTHIVKFPHDSEKLIEVYGEIESADYEWLFKTIDNVIIKDTINDGEKNWPGRHYGSAEIALRDALMVASGMPDPFY